MTKAQQSTAIRAALLLSAVNLVGYVGYRYTFAPPPPFRSVYATIFGLSVLLAVAGIALALEPFLLAGEGRLLLAVRGALTGFGAVWMATGLQCAHSLAAGVARRPLGGSLDVLHMVSDHIFLPLGVAALAWVPARLVGRGERPTDALSDVRPGWMRPSPARRVDAQRPR